MLHNEGLTTRNYTSYNFQVLRDDVYMLGIDGTVTGNRIAPVRSACAVVVSSQNANRDWLYQHAADYVRAGIQRLGVQHICSAYGPRHGDEGVHRLPCLGGEATTTRGWRSYWCRARTS